MLRLGKAFVALLKRFSIKYFPVGNERIKSIFFKKYIKYIEINDFIILSKDFVETNKGIIYDETFINHGEETDLSLKITVNKYKTTIISYEIGDYIGSTLGMGNDRILRSIAGLSYLNNKWDKKFREVFYEG